MLVIVQHEAAAALTAVASEGVHTLVLAASVFFGALVYVCGDVGTTLIKKHFTVRSRKQTKLTELTFLGPKVCVSAGAKDIFGFFSCEFDRLICDLICFVTCDLEFPPVNSTFSHT